ncbi:MAG: divergent polysaccharide deacetylase family protein [Cellulosilyticaceae bacterium]
MKKLMMILSSFLMFGMVLFAKENYVVLIIDDFGNNMKGTKQILELPIPLTGAVIPGMPSAVDEAKALALAGKEVILHVPLEPITGKPSWLGPLGITVGMRRDQVLSTLDKAYLDIPQAVGMNNHMGSKAMKNEVIVSSLMNFAKDKGFYFVDSGTTDTKLSERLSREYDVPFFKRSVFLDNEPSKEQVKAKLRELTELAKTHGVAIGIGHVGTYKGEPTAAAIKEMIPYMQDEGITFVTISQLIELESAK